MLYLSVSIYHKLIDGINETKNNTSLKIAFFTNALARINTVLITVSFICINNKVISDIMDKES